MNRAKEKLKQERHACFGFRYDPDNLACHECAIYNECWIKTFKMKWNPEKRVWETGTFHYYLLTFQTSAPIGYELQEIYVRSYQFAKERLRTQERFPFVGKQKDGSSPMLVFINSKWRDVKSVLKMSTFSK